MHGCNKQSRSRARCLPAPIRSPRKEEEEGCSLVTRVKCLLVLNLFRKGASYCLSQEGALKYNPGNEVTRSPKWWSCGIRFLFMPLTAGLSCESWKKECVFFMRRFCHYIQSQLTDWIQIIAVTPILWHWDWDTDADSACLPLTCCPCTWWLKERLSPHSRRPATQETSLAKLFQSVAAI